jgi:uncharacterized iron-regulated protein
VGGTRAGVVAALVVALAGCATAQPPVPPWEAGLGRDHPLTGRIWASSAGAFIEPQQLLARLATARFVLLGEKHDNPDHHRLQAWHVRELLAAGRRPAVAFEMLSEAQADALRRHLAAAPTDAAGLGPAVAWERSGWPDWAQYRPIAEAALRAGVPILPANIPPVTARAVARGSLAALDPALVSRYALDRPLPGAAAASLAEELRQAHCGHIAEPMLAGMATAQRARDARMAESLVTGGGRDGAVLIAGAGHVRNDRGVPAYLAAREPGSRVASVAFVEVQDSRVTARAHAAPFDDDLPFDYVWFTPRMDDEDPCERFRRKPAADHPSRQTRKSP